MFRRPLPLVVLSIAAVVAAPAGPAPAGAAPPATSPVAVGFGGAVATVDADATRVGIEVLRAGGNAVDAAVATAFAMAVTYPIAGNIGGGGFMLVHPPHGEPIVFEYRETAPAAARPSTAAPPGSVSPRAPGSRLTV